MNPILLGDEVAQGLRDLVRTSFSSSSPVFSDMIERFLDQPRSLLQGPWISVELPFRPGPSDEAFPEIPLGYRAYIHQRRAFERLGGANPKSTLVATGTGSGKTESFLWPILDACRRHKGEPGIKAIIIYPMNALAGDQAKRIAAAIERTPALQGLRCGLYADAEPSPAADVMTKDSVITRRQAMLNQPPDILLTNYKMLDYLLVRGQDKELWSKNTPHTLRFLVVDELHSFDGAQGADLALLIRRLKARLKTPAEHLACIGSSATLGSGADAGAQLRAYAADIFGEPFETDSVIGEDRLSVREALEASTVLDFPDQTALIEACSRARDLTQAAAAELFARLWIAEFDPSSSDYDKTLPADPGSDAWRLALSEKLRAHAAVSGLVSQMSGAARPMSMDTLADRLAEWRPLRGWGRPGLKAFVISLVSLIAWARARIGERIRPFLNVRVQYWTREMARMASTWEQTDEGWRPVLHHSQDLDGATLARALPITHCGRCGMTAHLASIRPTGSSVWAPLDTLYEAFFEGSNSLRLICYEPVAPRRSGTGHGSVEGRIYPHNSWQFAAGADQTDQNAVKAWIYDLTDAHGQTDRSCPSCGAQSSLQILGLRSARLTASLTTTLFQSRHHEPAVEAKPRTLMFSDSVQDAAQRAAVTEARNAMALVRKSVYRALGETADGSRTLADLSEKLPQELRQEYGDPGFVGRFTPQDQRWRREFEELVETGEIATQSLLADHVTLRLGWEIVSDLTYRSHSGETLEASKLCSVDANPSALLAAAQGLGQKLAAHVHASLALTPDEAAGFLRGMTATMRRRGAVAHSYVQSAVEAADARGLSYFPFQRSRGLWEFRVLPIPAPTRSPAPVVPSLTASARGIERVNRTGASNWWSDWAFRILGHRHPALHRHMGEIYEVVFRHCEEYGLLRSVRNETAGLIWLLRPDMISVTRSPAMVTCSVCRRSEVTTPALSDQPMPCPRIGCKGHLTRGAAPAASPHLRSLFSTPYMHRVHASEHTGLLDSDERRALERRFIEGENPWDSNVISATPTLEMGIDIGDLSSVILCSMPPEEANYIQRIGRSGRRDGNSCNVTIANARPHDLQFWEAPETMIAGRVRPPGVFLSAGAVLKRQATAFALDCYVQQGLAPNSYGKVKEVLSQLDQATPTGFPFDWFEWLGRNGDTVYRDFIRLLPEKVQTDRHLGAELYALLTADDDQNLAWRVRAAFEAAKAERSALLTQQQEIDAERKRLRALAPPPQDLEERLEHLRDNRREISSAIRALINDVRVLEFLTTQGLLPNYAFPEEGVKLKTFIARVQRQNLGDDERYVTQEFVRQASSALNELAPFQTFYAAGRQFEIDRLELAAEGPARQRFCRACTYSERDIGLPPQSACPKCGDAMWTDAGRVFQTIELRTAIAATTEAKSFIRDEDQRVSIQFDRAIFPSYDKTGVELAYGVSGDDVDTPFGFEFIPSCELNDYNFGPRDLGGQGQTIAGEGRKSHPFYVCTACGKAQKRPVTAAQAGDHMPRCRVLRERTLDMSWQAAVYLTRKFETEAIRLIVPVFGAPDNDQIKSFVAAVQLGMRRHFEGRIDHIRSFVVEEQVGGQAGARSLYLYDTVPGGSGYLRQLAESPAALHSVFEKAAETLRTCPCIDEQRDGCHRCVKSYSALFGAGHPRRGTALDLVERVLGQWRYLKPISGPLDDKLKSGLVDSILEARFLEALKHRFKDGKFTPKLLAGAKRGFQLTIPQGAGGENPLRWTIEPQVKIDQRIAGAPQRRVDFLLTIDAMPGILPIVIELDGWEHHAPTVAQDLRTRLLIQRTGKAVVWSLTWEDLNPDASAGLNPFASTELPPSVAQRLGHLWRTPEFSALHGYRDEIEAVQTQGTFDLLCDILKNPRKDSSAALAVLARLVIGQGQSARELAAASGLSATVNAMADACEQGTWVKSGQLRLMMMGPVDVAPPKITDPCAYRFVVVSPDVQDSQASLPERQNIWRGLLRLLSVLQVMPGLHAVYSGIEDLPPPDVSGDGDKVWREARELLTDTALKVLDALRQRGAVCPPDIIGEDIMDGDRVAGQIEFGWSGSAVGVSLGDEQISGWRLTPLDRALEDDQLNQLLEASRRHANG
jgi:DEAD/DEAH box helicase domain-containing protein